MASSFRTRLVVLYTALTSLALIGFSLIIYFSIQYQSYRNLEADLAKRASHVIEQIDFKDGKLVLPPSITRVSALEMRYEALLDADGEAFFTNPILEGRSIALTASDIAGVEYSPKIIDSSLNDDTPVKLALIKLKRIPGNTYFITASPISEVEATLESLASAMLFANVLFIVLIAGIGYVFARRALKPVHEITRMARDISHGDLQKRVNLQGPDDELKELADTFDEMLARLEELFESQKQFFQDVSHELRTPLTIIRGKLDVALRSKNATIDDYRAALKDVLAESEYATRLVNDLLRVARGEKLAETLTMIDFPAERMLVEVGSRITALGKQKGVRVDMTTPGDAVMIRGDEQQLGEAILAIGDNAVRHCGAGCEVAISLTVESPWAVISVADTGEGIPEADLPHIFDRFYRANGQKAREGSGLGLAIAKQIVDTHGGRLDAISSHGKGTEFSLYIPLANG